MTFIHLKSFTYDKIMLEEILSLPKKKKEYGYYSSSVLY